MNRAEMIYQIARLVCATFLVLAVLVEPPMACAQDGLSGLTDAEVLEQLSRKAYREEFQRRYAGYVPEKRAALVEEFRNGAGRRMFPVEFTTDELLELAMDTGDPNPVSQALQELKKRYEDASEEERIALSKRLRAEYQTTPHPVLLPDMSNTAEYTTNQEKYSAVDRVAKALLPEPLALSLYREVYLDSGQKGAITAFLSRVANAHLRGPATLAILKELRTRTAALDEDELDALGEHEAVESIVYMAIRDCSDNSFEAIKARDWQKNDLDIYAMGNFDNPEARELLLVLYETLPKEWLLTDKRLRVLSALIARWDREHDLEFRDLLRHELTDILKMDHSANLYYLGRTVDVIAETRDPYYIPLLKKRRANLSPAAIRGTSPSPENVLDTTVISVQKQLDSAIAALEKTPLAQR